jgi:hypothetical protein
MCALILQVYLHRTSILCWFPHHYFYVFHTQPTMTETYLQPKSFGADIVSFFPTTQKFFCQDFKLFYLNAIRAKKQISRKYAL